LVSTVLKQQQEKEEQKDALLQKSLVCRQQA
jgi:hypothetical protein